MANLFSNLTRNFSNIFNGFGRDQYTQTRVLQPRLTDLTKSEQWVDCSHGNLYNLYNTTSSLKLVINRGANMYANGRIEHIKNGEVVENSLFTQRLENPNPLMNGNELMRSEWVNYHVFGNSFQNLVKGAMLGIPPHAIYVLPSQDIVIKRTGKIFKQIRLEDIIESYCLDINGQTKDVFEVGDVVHLKTTNPNDPVIGESLLVSLMMEISNTRGAMGFRNRIIRSNSALGIISSNNNGEMGATFDVDEIKQANDAHGAAFGMQEGKSDYMITEANIKYTPTAYKTKDLLLFEEVDGNLKTIIDTFGLNDNIFSFQKASTFSNLLEGIRLAYQDCIIPYAEDRALAWTKAFGMDGINEYIKINYDHLQILQKDNKDVAATDKLKAETYGILMGNGNTVEAGKIYEG